MRIIDLATSAEPADLDQLFSELYPNHPQYASGLPRRACAGDDHEMADLVVVEEGRIRGRLIMMSVPWADQILGERIAYFTGFECIRSEACVRALFDQARMIARDWRVNKIRGPMTPFISDSRGVLVSNHDLGPTLGLAFNPDYYDGLLEAAGLGTIKELYSYVFREGDMDHLEPVVRFVKLRNRSIVLEEMDFSDTPALAGRIADLYNLSWQDAWSFFPLQKPRIQAVIEASRPILDPSMNFFLRDGDRTIGVFMAVPNVQRDPRGDGSAYRGMLFGVDPQYRKRGLEILMAYTGYRRAVSMGMSSLEIGWVLESNRAWVQQIKKMLGSGHIRKAFKLYELDL